MDIFKLNLNLRTASNLYKDITEEYGAQVISTYRVTPQVPSNIIARIKLNMKTPNLLTKIYKIDSYHPEKVWAA